MKIDDKPLVYGYDKVGTHYETSRKLKSLNTTAGKLKSNIAKNRQLIKTATADNASYAKQLEEVEEALQAIKKNGELIVSEHALLRYLERYMNVNLDEVIEKIRKLPPEMVVNKGTTIVTILDDHTPEALTSVSGLGGDTGTLPSRDNKETIQ